MNSSGTPDAQARVDHDNGEVVITVRLPVPPANVAQGDRLIDVEKSGEEGLETRAIKRLIKAGKLPRLKLGRKYFVRYSDLLGLVTPVASRTTKARKANREDPDFLRAHEELIRSKS